MLSEGRISLSVAGRLAPHLREDNVETLLADCAGMTKRAVEEYLIRLKPLPVFEPSIRKLSDAQASTAPELPSQPAPRPSQPPATAASGLLAPATPELCNFRFSAAKDFKLKLKLKLERLAEVLGIENPAKNMAEILEKALGLALEAKDPRRRLERRLARKRRQEDAALKSQSARCESRPGEVSTNEPATSRHVPASVRDRATRPRLRCAGFRRMGSSRRAFLTESCWARSRRSGLARLWEYLLLRSPRSGAKS